MAYNDIPILFLIFNRPETTRQVFEIIRKVQPKQLFVAADGARKDRPDEIQKCQEARQVIMEGIVWECDVQILFHDENLGCGAAVSTALAWFFDHVEEGIILEDDTLPDLSFFPYCKKLLELYRHDERVWSISGFNFGTECFKNDDEYLFARFMNMWGWATWKRTHKEIDYNLADWKSSKNKRLFTSLLVQYNFFDIDINWVDFWTDKFEKVTNNEIDTWDYQWIYSQLVAKKLTIYPSKNLIQNIGFTENATHTTDVNNPISKILRDTMKADLKKRNIKIDKAFENKFLKEVWCNYIYKRYGYRKLLMFKMRQFKYFCK